MATSNKLYLYDGDGNFIRTVEKDVFRGYIDNVKTRSKNTQRRVYDCDGCLVTTISNEVMNRLEDSHMSTSSSASVPRTPRTPRKKQSSPAPTGNIMTRKRLFVDIPVQKSYNESLDSDWEPVDNELEDPTYEYESDDSWEEEDEPYEYSDWYYNNVINA
tara:strand:- start:5525 stop:6004 length:480 start_codon:yes stop_codon:yes gene_type:complete